MYLSIIITFYKAFSTYALIFQMKSTKLLMKHRNLPTKKSANYKTLTLIKRKQSKDSFNKKKKAKSVLFAMK